MAAWLQIWLPKHKTAVMLRFRAVSLGQCVPEANTNLQWSCEPTQIGMDEVTIKTPILKGTVSRDFLLLVFFFNQFPPSLWLYHSNFFKNSRRYSQLKVCHRCQGHRWQMEKTFKQKNFNNFVLTPLGSRVNIYINLCLQVHFKVSAAWYCCHYLPPVSLIPVVICHRRRWHRWQICRRYRWHRINNTSENGVNICRRCRWYR